MLEKIFGSKKNILHKIFACLWVGGVFCSVIINLIVILDACDNPNMVKHVLA